MTKPVFYSLPPPRICIPSSRKGVKYMMSDAGVVVNRQISHNINNIVIERMFTVNAALDARVVVCNGAQIDD